VAVISWELHLGVDGGTRGALRSRIKQMDTYI
jgi:hypothetical protein